MSAHRFFPTPNSPPASMKSLRQLAVNQVIVQIHYVLISLFKPIPDRLDRAANDLVILLADFNDFLFYLML